MRSTHNVHFCIVPRTSLYSRAPYGHAHEHSLQPMHLSSSTSTMPSSARLSLASVGHTVTQSGVSKCRQERGKCTVIAPASLFSPLAARPSPLWTSNVCTRLNH